MARRSNSFRHTNKEVIAANRAAGNIESADYGDVYLNPLNLVDAARKAAISAQIREIEREKAQKRAQTRELIADAKRSTADIARKVGQLLASQNILTSQQFNRLIAQAQAELQVGAIEAFDQVRRGFEAGTENIALYMAATEALRKRGFRLFVQDESIVQPLDNADKLYARLTRLMNDYAQEIIYASLIDTLIECFDRLTEDQFPTEYRGLMLSAVEAAQVKRSFSRSSNYLGPNIKTWSINVDFDKIFGDYGDFRAGFHYGALLRDQTRGKRKNRVRLPYGGQVMKNKTSVRYGYWKAMWAGKSKYYGGYETPAQNRAAQQANIDRKLDEQKENLKQIYLGAMEEGRLKRSRGKFHYQPTDEERASELRISNIRAGLELKRSKIRTRSIDIPEGQRAETIAARVGYWASKGVAPFWHMLEFGQFEFEPRIPPLGLTYKFYTKAKKGIDELARIVWNKYLSSEAGYTFDIGGNRRYAGQQGYAVNYFTNVNPNIRKGTQLPKNVIPASQAVYRTARRNAEEAEAAAGTFAGTRYSGYIQNFGQDAATVFGHISFEQYGELFGVEGLPEGYARGIRSTPLEVRPTGGGQYTRSKFKDFPDIPKIDRRTRTYKLAKKRIINAG